MEQFMEKMNMGPTNHIPIYDNSEMEQSSVFFNYSSSLAEPISNNLDSSILFQHVPIKMEDDGLFATDCPAECSPGSVYNDRIIKTDLDYHASQFSDLENSMKLINVSSEKCENEEAYSQQRHIPIKQEYLKLSGEKDEHSPIICGTAQKRHVPIKEELTLQTSRRDSVSNHDFNANRMSRKKLIILQKAQFEEFLETRRNQHRNHAKTMTWCSFQNSCNPARSIPKSTRNSLFIESNHIAMADAYHITTLIEAVASQNLEAVGNLLMAGADVNKVGACDNTPLGLAVKLGNLYIVELLVKFGATVHNDCLSHTIEKNNLKMLRFFLDETNVFTNIIDESGFTPLTKAINLNHVDAVEMLIAAGANPNQMDSREYPLTKSIKGRSYAIFMLLVDAGADINLVDNKGRPLLSLAASMEDYTITTYLILKGANYERSLPELVAFAEKNQYFSAFFGAALGLDSSGYERKQKINIDGCFNK